MDKILWLILLHKAWFSHADFKKISGELDDFWFLYREILENKIQKFPWMTDEKWRKIRENVSKISPTHFEKILREKEIQIITLESEQYPEKLKNIKQAPYMLYVRWNLKEERKMLGIVWSRKNTNYGKKVLENIIPELIQSGCWIISGGAFGIDAIAHEITLMQGWYTISVFGCSVDIYYPSQNTILFEKILEKWWALVSIFPLGSKAEPYMFPVRNEIVAALSDGIIIPEAWRKSGTLITAWLALEHWRDVFVVPWDIFRETSEWCNELISRGEGKCVSSAREILEEYFGEISRENTSLFSQKVFDTEEKKIVYNAISEWYNTPDSIWENSDLTIDTIIMTLALLEIEWYLQLWSWWKYEIIC
jgi:DNA processing protein